MTCIIQKLPTRGFLSLMLLLVRLPKLSDAIQLKTSSSRLVGVGGLYDGSRSVDALQKFIARPIHWPDIVLSSNRVEVLKKNKKQESAPKSFTLFQSRKKENTASGTIVEPSTDNPSFEALQVGDTVIEYFALNQFQVEWTCTTNEPGRLVVVSPNGVPGIATDCVMDFEFDESEGTDDDAEVRLTMEYTPESPLAVLATPALVIDNWLALNVLLPAAVDTRPLDSYRKLMGILYGIAGVSHLVDLLVGGSQLFTTVMGIPSFQDLELVGQLYSLLWCAVGPIAYYLSVTTDSSVDDTDGLKIKLLNKADIGLVLYGIVELFGAGFSSGFSGSSPDILSNAAGVQAIVLLAWLYSYQKQQQQLESSLRV